MGYLGQIFMKSTYLRSYNSEDGVQREEKSSSHKDCWKKSSDRLILDLRRVYSLIKSTLHWSHLNDKVRYGTLITIQHSKVITSS